ncbi:MULTISPECIES: hypothetical protein [unclassified Methylophaga]|jgi:hypothetical protein|uniref:hypothetical protein n=1 Tax=unclassified Methylophaga TaxID=2629249 RepID=UPI00259CF699|nr:MULTISPECIES: hypothetical protein [unclassified Methylophaga]|tara:strand:+ start:1593 stop:2186 length:594 start_codon:yes stop_codon:yes gene_type:complete
MLKNYLKHVHRFLFIVLASISMQALASDSLIPERIESFKINGLSLNSSVEEFKELTKNGFKCRVKDRFDVNYWTCRSNQKQKNKIKLIVGVDNNKIVSINYSSQSTTNSFAQLRSDTAELNQVLLEEGFAHTGRNPNDKEIFFYNNDESPVTSKTEMFLKTTLECSMEKPSIYGLEVTIMTVGQLDNVGVTMYKMHC